MPDLPYNPVAAPWTDNASPAVDPAFLTEVERALTAADLRYVSAGTLTPFLGASEPGLAGGHRYQMVGLDVGANVGYFAEVGNNARLVASFDEEVTWRDKGLPAGTSLNMTSAGGLRTSVVRYGANVYTMVVNGAGLTEIHRGVPVTGTTAIAWELVDTMQSGAQGYVCTLAASPTAIAYVEYGDPVDGLGVKAARIRRSTTGDPGSWVTVWTGPNTTRHGHALEPNPDVPGHWVMTGGDSGGRIVMESTDDAATWPTITSTNTAHQSVQISYDLRGRIYLAADQDGAVVSVLDRLTGVIRHGAMSSHEDLAVNRGAAGEQHFGKPCFGAVHRPTGNYFFVANDSLVSPPNHDYGVKGIFYIPAYGGRVICLHTIRPPIAGRADSGTDAGSTFGRLFFYRGGIRVGSFFQRMPVDELAT